MKQFRGKILILIVLICIAIGTVYFLDNNLQISYRYFNPFTEGAYSWWSYRFNARKNNSGWRIDYFCTSKRLEDRLVSAKIHNEVLGSDHCPVELVIK